MRHSHQYQANIPSYNRTVADVGRHLGTSGTDWILGYSFPYKQPNVVAAFKVMTDRALAFLSNRLADKDRQLIADYLKARRAARAASGDVAWVYAEFQIGQEGVARWTELTLGRRASRTDAAVAAVAADRWAGLTTSLRAINDQGLAIWRRNAFYVLGAVEAEMLDRVKPDWRDAYVRHPFSLGQQLEDCCGEADPSSETASG